MILVDAGPLVAIFNAADNLHEACMSRVESLMKRRPRPPLATTVPVLTEAFHMLSPRSTAPGKLRQFVGGGGLSVHIPSHDELLRAFELMEQYSDRPMDFADASLIAAAETLGTREIFTVDLADFQTFRIRRGHRSYAVNIV